MVNENAPDFEATFFALEDACAEGQPWHVIARCIAKVGRGDHSWWRWSVFLGEKAPGFTPAVVMQRRYVSTLKNIEKIAASNDREVSSVLPSSFTGAELAVRLYERDPILGLSALTALRERKTTLEAVRELLKAAPAPKEQRSRYDAAVDRAERSNRCSELFYSAVPGLFGAGAIAERRPILRHFRRWGFEVSRGEEGIVAGVDLYLVDPQARETQIIEPIAQSALLSFYLPSFYVLFEQGAAQAVLEGTDEALLTMNVPWVGILRIDDSGLVRTFRQPSGQRPDFEGASAYSQIVGSFGDVRPPRRKVDEETLPPAGLRFGP